MGDDCQRCHHDRSLHVPLAGYPGEVIECWGTDECDCPGFVEEDVR